MSAYGYTVSQTGDLDLKRLKQAGQEHSGSITLGIGVCSHDYLADSAVFYTLEQLVYPELIGAYVAEGGDNAVEHVIQTVVLMGALNGDKILGVGHDAHGSSIAL